ncbi:MAG: hypothetical protein MRZ79_04815 [Bacteroidia bacterium]|nr:hypothetical protein [Bacteroidia bacterium]
MFNAIILPMWAMATGAFWGTKEVRHAAGVAFVCFVLSLAGSLFTAYLSQPIYADMIPAAGMEVAWAISAAIAFAMFILASNLAEYISSRIDQRRAAVTTNRVAVYAIIFVLVGAFDGTLNYFGSPIRSEQAYVVETFSEKLGKGKMPFSEEIAAIDQTIESNKVMYRGKWTVRWDARDEVRELQRQRADFVKLQQEAIRADRQHHQGETEKKLNRQSFATWSFRLMSVAIYVLMLLISIPIAGFIDLWDMQDGKRDRKLAKGKPAKDIGYRSVATAMQGEKAGEKIGEKEAVDFKLSPQAELRENPGDFSAGKAGESEYHEKVILTGETDNRHPKYSRQVQPDKYRGLSKAKYKRFVKAAREVLESQGRYNKTAIASRAGIDRKTVSTYLRVAIENKDLTA